MKKSIINALHDIFTCRLFVEDREQFYRRNDRIGDHISYDRKYADKSNRRI